MPVMEFEGNLSWGYNTVYHLAADKRYGPPSKLKEFIDLCHQNGIAVILDVALNHVFGRSPLERMWMTDTDNDGWGNGITAENPYCNQAARHSYNVGSDLNHFREPDNLTNTYSLRTIKTWIEDYKIDGFRWDLTKGFTQNCPSTVSGGQDNCTNNYQQDRVDVLKTITQLPLGNLEQAESLEQLRWVEHGISITLKETELETIAIDTPDDLQHVLSKFI